MSPTLLFMQVTGEERGESAERDTERYRVLVPGEARGRRASTRAGWNGPATFPTSWRTMLFTGAAVPCLGTVLRRSRSSLSRVGTANYRPTTAGWLAARITSRSHTQPCSIWTTSYGGGWGRIIGITRQLIAFGEDAEALLGPDPEAKLAEMATRDPCSPDEPELESWIETLETDHDVFFSAPLDVDLALLASFEASYKRLVPKGGGPRQIPRTDPARAKRLEAIRRACLGADGGSGETDTEKETRLFRWYSHLFVSGSKPVAHARALAELDDAAIRKSCPDALSRIVRRAETLADA